ncbi:hypothetical protein [Taibaiella helva]|uniref:hypothetical protein n=1 Tax=Taibaiella helva TaxID=2301235 RepID=UPI0013007899|nr:hypothetical protein [Taibaiella helva]
MRKDIVQSKAIDELGKKLGALGYKPQPERVSGQSIAFTSSKGKPLEVIVCLLNLAIHTGWPVFRNYTPAH